MFLKSIKTRNIKKNFSTIGQLCLITLSLIPWTKEKFENSLKAYYCGFEKKSIITSAIGAFVLGSGMTLCGAVSRKFYIML